ncbi:hypothetical protein RRG08_021181 [Elysia crispata]|uniref:Uncharacterized protein n=1 Tax=Elysia crispata TaxID=231223 RepID=A0AAE1BA46_9GAST|nr:hypothetical protein RRG08_021181 [Elysia crispata]
MNALFMLQEIETRSVRRGPKQSYNKLESVTTSHMTSVLVYQTHLNTRWRDECKYGKVPEWPALTSRLVSQYHIDALWGARWLGPELMPGQQVSAYRSLRGRGRVYSRPREKREENGAEEGK